MDCFIIADSREKAGGQGTWDVGVHGQDLTTDSFKYNIIVKVPRLNPLSAFYIILYHS